MTPDSFRNWLNDQPSDLPLGDRSWVHNPLANYCADNGIKTLPMPAWGLRFVNAIQTDRLMTKHLCLCALALAALTTKPDLVGVA